MKIYFYTVLGLMISSFSFFENTAVYVSDIEMVAKDTIIGQAIDSLNGVYVYYNGAVSHVSGRNITAEGYNLGLKYQCVEFAKRYYYEYLNHKMPDSYGHAKDLFNKSLADGMKNKQRNLIQYKNSSSTKPQVDDLLVFDATDSNGFGHVAIILKVSDDEVEVIQQNPVTSNNSREVFKLTNVDGRWLILEETTLGWLRKE